MSEKDISSVTEMLDFAAKMNAVQKDRGDINIRVSGSRVLADLGIIISFEDKAGPGCGTCTGTCSDACTGCTACSGCSGCSGTAKNSSLEQAGFVNELAQKVAAAIGPQLGR